ncbi:MAG: lactate racemase domain-containing protein, partial [Clostridium baratii]|nr:lactate racemase domain-containing protein [Clostridium baratii]
MANFKIPYHTKMMSIEVDDNNLVGVLESKADEYKTDLTEQEIVEKALDNPIGSERLEDLVKGKKDMVIITSDHTRPVP